MNKFKCLNCSRAFDEPLFIRENERIDYGIGSQWVTLWEGEVSPCCESSDFEVFENEEEEEL